MVKVSIILPVYNDGDLLEKSINSVLNQSLDDIEIVCVNDGSTDNSLKVLETFKNKYGFIKVFSQENQGSGKARNRAIDESEGEYIAFLDADDFFIDSDALEKLYSVAKSKNANMVSGNIKLVDGEGNFSPFKDLDYYRFNKKIAPEDYGIPWAFYKSIYKRDFLVDNEIYFPDLIRGQDPVFLAEVLSKVDEIYTVRTDFYAYYYINGANQCNTFRKRYDHINHFRYVFKYFEDPKFENLRIQFKRKLFIFIDMMGIEGAKDTLFSIRKIFSDDICLVNECEEYYFSKFYNNYEVLKELDLLIKPIISVIIPVYNAEPFLEDAIKSILNQSFRNIELVCVNDGSTDNSLKILKSFQEKDWRVKIFDKENGGCGSARNMSLNNAKGDYIYFFDPDDYVLPNAFEELYDNSIKNDSDLVMFKIARFRDGEPVNYNEPGFDFENIFGNVDFNDFTFNYKDIKEHVLNSSFAPWSKFYKKSFLDKYDDFRFDLNVAFDDVPFHVKSLLRASRISFIPDYFYYYRLSNPNSVNNTKSNQIDIFKICDLVEDFLKKENYFDDFKKEFFEFKITQIRNYLFSCNFVEYYDLTKKEFSELAKEDLYGLGISENLLADLNLVLESESYNDLRLMKGHDTIDENYFENNMDIINQFNLADSPKVSVIVPVYNTEKYLSKCLDSLIYQTLEDIEIICVDDGSSDNSLNILKQYENKDDRVKVISKENGGAGSARNLGLSLAKGEYINFIDSDDWLDLNTLEELYIKSKYDNLDVLMYQLINFNNSDGEFYETDYYNMACLDSKFDNAVFNYEDVGDDMFSLAVSPCNKFINRNFLINLNYPFAEGVMFEDNPYFFNLFVNASRIAVIRKHYYFRRRREGSVMELNSEKLNDIMPMTNNVLDIFIDKGLHLKFTRRLTNFKLYSINTFYNQVKTVNKDSYFNAMKKDFEKIYNNKELLQLFNSGLDSYTSVFFYNALTALSYQEFEALMGQHNLKQEIERLKSSLDRATKDLNLEKQKYESLKRQFSELSNQKNSLNLKTYELYDDLDKLKLLELRFNDLLDENYRLNILVNRKNDEILYLKNREILLRNDPYLKKYKTSNSNENSVFKRFSRKLKSFF